MTQQDADTNHIKQLRTALAINRGMELLEQLPADIAKTVEHDEAQRRGYLELLYTRIHRSLFRNWKQDSVSQRPGDIVDSGAREALRTALLETLCYPNGGHNGNNGHAAAHVPEPLFDSNGFVIRQDPEKLGELLGDFYGKMRKIRPFAYGNELTLNFFMMALGKLPAFKEPYGSIDFRRMDDDDYAALHSTHAPQEALKTAFVHALDASRTPVLNNTRDGYDAWPKHVKIFMGIPFLSQEAKDGTECLVTVNGGMVPFDAIRENLKKEIASNAPIADWTPIRKDQLVGYVPGTEELREPGKKDIDGIPVTSEAAPLFCLDFNILTGLRPLGHDDLVDLIKQVEGKDAPVFNLANNPMLRDKLLARVAPGDERMRRTIEIGYEHLSKVTNRLNAEQAIIFAGKEPEARPHFIASFGGAGTGKSLVEDIIKAKCGGNYVKASLDSFREHSDLYKVLTAADHHADDYRLIEPFANTLRDWVSKTARRKHINVLYDGTGIPHAPRSSELARSFKENGFTTEIVAVDAPLEVAIKRVKKRFDEKHRALPWIVVIGKHVRMASSFMHAVEDPYVDKISLFANDHDDPEMKSHYLVAETFPGADGEAARQRAGGKLAEYMRSRASSHEESVLHWLADKAGEGINGLLDRIPGFKNGNLFELSYPMGKDTSRTLAIYDTRRFTKFLEKGMLNPHASDEAGLKKLPETLSFVTRRNDRQEQGARNGASTQARGL